MKPNQQEKCDGELLSNCCAWDFNPMGFEKEPGIWQERCIRCGRLCEPLWISERDIKNIRRLTEFEKPIPLPTPPETGKEWEEGLKKIHSRLGDYGDEVWYNGSEIKSFIRSLLSKVEATARAEGEKAENKRIRKAMMSYKCKFTADKNSYVSVKDIFKVLDALNGGGK